MPTRITKELIAGIGLVADRKSVTLRGGKYELFVRKLNANETISFIELNDNEDRAEQLRVMTSIVAAVCVNEDGTQQFTDEDKDLIAKAFSLEDMTAIVGASTGMEAEAIEEKPDASSEATV